MDSQERTQPHPVISPSPDGSRFWAALAEHRLVLPLCLECDLVFFYPRGHCPRCGSRSIDWTESAGTGTIYSFCVHYRSATPGLGEAVPFVTVLVDLDEGPRLMGFLAGSSEDPLAGPPADPAEIQCGARVLARPLSLPDGRAALAFARTP